MKLLYKAIALALFALPAFGQVTQTYEASTGLAPGLIPKTAANGQLVSSACGDNGTIVSCSESIDVQGNAIVQEIANAGSTGTTVNKLAKLTGAPSTAVITATTDPLSSVVGIVMGGAGTTGSAQIAVAGQASCVFDGATTAGDYVTISSTTAGDCHDNGTSIMALTIGRVLSTNGGGGTYAVALSISGSAGGASFTWGVPLPNPTMIRVFGSNLSIGTNDLYTVPTGRRALILGCAGISTSAGNTTVVPQVKISGTYYPLAGSSTAPNSAINAINGTAGLVFEAADIFSLVTSVNNNANIQCSVVEFDNTSGLKAARLIGTTTGDNTVYTCVHTCIIMPGTATAGTAPMYSNSAIRVINDSGGSHSFYLNVVPSGGTPATGNKMGIAASQVASNIALVNSQPQITMATGDFISVNTTAGAATQVIMAAVIDQ